MITFNKHIITLYIIIGLLLFSLFLQRSCNNNITKSNTIVTIPQKDGTFVKTKPHEIKYDTILRDTIIYKDKKIIIDNTDKNIVQNYLNAKDSIEKLKVLINSAKIRTYKEVYDDKNITLTVNAETTGTLNWIKPEYIIKESSISVPSITKNTVFAGYLGGGINTNLTSLKPELLLKAGFQNKRGDILLGGYGTHKTIQVEYIFKVFDIKK